jgi:hypothetical protein
MHRHIIYLEDLGYEVGKLDMEDALNEYKEYTKNNKGLGYSV